jgi:hypothetical protein
LYLKIYSVVALYSEPPAETMEGCDNRSRRWSSGDGVSPLFVVCRGVVDMKVKVRLARGGLTMAGDAREKRPDAGPLGQREATMRYLRFALLGLVTLLAVAGA